MNVHIPVPSIPAGIPTPVILIVGAIIFIIVLGLAHMSREFITWAFSGAGIGFIAGIIVTVAIGAAIAHFGKGTVQKVANLNLSPNSVKDMIANKGIKQELKENKDIASVEPQLESSVLGEQTKENSVETIIGDYSLLNSSQQANVRSYICE